MLQRLSSLTNSDLNIELSSRNLSNLYNASREEKIMHILDNEVKTLYHITRTPSGYNPYKIVQNKLNSISLTFIEFANKPEIDTLSNPIDCINYSKIAGQSTLMYVSKLPNDILVKIIISKGIIRLISEIDTYIDLIYLMLITNFKIIHSFDIVAFLSEMSTDILYNLIGERYIGPNTRACLLFTALTGCHFSEDPKIDKRLSTVKKYNHSKVIEFNIHVHDQLGVNRLIPLYVNLAKHKSSKVETEFMASDDINSIMSRIGMEFPGESKDIKDTKMGNICKREYLTSNMKLYTDIGSDAKLSSMTDSEILKLIDIKHISWSSRLDLIDKAEQLLREWSYTDRKFIFKSDFESKHNTEYPISVVVNGTLKAILKSDDYEMYEYKLGDSIVIISEDQLASLHVTLEAIIKTETEYREEIQKLISTIDSIVDS